MANYRPEGLAGPKSAPYTTSKSKVTPLHHIQVQSHPPYTTPKSKVTPIIPHPTSLHDT